MRVLVVEDEPLARDTLRAYLDAEVDVELVGEAADGPAAVAAIERLKPNVVFLDIRLPGLSGLEVLERSLHRPWVVFTTAYDRYAVAAFEVEAVDYLVKPFGRRRFGLTLERVRRRFEMSRGLPAGEGDPLPRSLRLGLVEHPLRRLFARRGGRIVPLPVERIDRIAGAGDYSEVHCGSDRYHVPLRLKELERRLDGERFVRIHRSHLVNLDRVAEMRPRDPHRLEVVLVSGATVPASRAGSARLRARIRRA